MATQTLHLPLTMPDDPGQRGLCARCIEERLSQRPGVVRARVLPGDEEGRDRRGYLDVDYDPDLVTLSQINGYLRSAGGCFGLSVAHIIMPVDGLLSTRHERAVQKSLSHLPGVRCSASYSSGTVRLEFDRQRCALPEIVRRLDLLGVTVRPPTEAATGAERPASSVRQPHWVRAALRQRDLVLALLAGVLLLAGFLVHVTGGSQQLRLALLLASYVCGGYYPAQAMIESLMRYRFDIDLLMFAAAFGAAALGQYEEGAMLLFLFSLGGAGERLAMHRARSAINALGELAPAVAVRVTPDGRHEEVPVEDLAVGDRVFVAPGQHVPADGRVADGESAINQAAITGESVPVDKAVGDDVFAGTINGDGAVTVEVTKLASDNTIARVIKMVEEAQTTKSPTQLFTDRVEKWYVPLVIAATAGLIVIPPLAGFTPMREHGSAWAGWFYQAMAFLTAASPCALAIGTPAAVLSGIARAARGGVLVKGGVHLENLGRVRAIAFDKTGTLTFGRPEVTEVAPLADGVNEGALLRMAASVEHGSRHPIAQAIVREAEGRGHRVEAALNIMQKPGVGICGDDVDGRCITLARPSSLDPALAGTDRLRARAAELEEQGRTLVAVADEDRVLGLIALADRPRDGVDQLIGELHRLGVSKTIMLTGDNPRTASGIAAHTGVDEHLADLLPEDKVAQVKRLDERYGRVAMVGDGVNDAPAMANATVGIAIGGAGAGSDVALETADIALLGSNLVQLPEAIGVSRFARRIIVQNLVIALGVIAILAPTAALGVTPLALAVLFHEGSTVVVVLNALRILAYRRRHPHAA